MNIPDAPPTFAFSYAVTKYLKNTKKEKRKQLTFDNQLIAFVKVAPSGIEPLS